jgi:hypothetical protein
VVIDFPAAEFHAVPWKPPFTPCAFVQENTINLVAMCPVVIVGVTPEGPDNRPLVLSLLSGEAFT